MPTISATIITKNESRHIGSCIEALLWADEIIILDCGSTDGTQDICKKYGPKVKLHETDWPGFGKQKNRALDLATSDWILSIDADEIITPELKAEILSATTNNDYIAYQIPRLTYFYNRPIRHCFKSDRDAPIRLAKNGRCRFSEDIVHEKMIVDGKIKKIKNELHHFSYYNLEGSINKINSYSTLNALKLSQTQKRTNAFQVLAHAIWTFIKIYFLNLGFLDGWPGFLIAFSNSEGTFYKYAKLLEKNHHLPLK